MTFEIFIALITVSLLVVAAFTVFAAVFGRKTGLPPASSKPLPRVCILKPMKDIDDGLEQNLEGFFNLAYPDYEIIFGVDSADDPCFAVINKITALNPSIRARIVLTGKTSGANPKIEKLAKMSENNESPVYWVSDSNTRVESDTLAWLVAEYLENDSKIVFSPIRSCGGKTLGSIMVNAYMNLFVSGNIIGAWQLFKKPIIVGKSMLIERETLQKLGGFLAFDQYLAEDYMMGLIYHRGGCYISTNYTWITNYASTTDIATFYARTERWAKMRFRIDPFFYCLEILSNPLALAFISIFFLGSRGAALFGLAYALKLALEYLNLFLVNKTDRRSLRVLAAYPLCVLVKDAILFAVYVISFFSSTVCWHGKTITIGSDSKISSLYTAEGKE